MPIRRSKSRGMLFYQECLDNYRGFGKLINFCCSLAVKPRKLQYCSTGKRLRISVSPPACRSPAL